MLLYLISYNYKYMSIPIINKDISRQVQKRIDKRISDLFIQLDHNICKPYVCILCDIFVKPKELRLISTKKIIKTFINLRE